MHDALLATLQITSKEVRDSLRAANYSRRVVEISLSKSSMLMFSSPEAEAKKATSNLIKLLLIDSLKAGSVPFIRQPNRFEHSIMVDRLDSEEDPFTSRVKFRACMWSIKRQCSSMVKNLALPSQMFGEFSYGEALNALLCREDHSSVMARAGLPLGASSLNTYEIRVLALAKSVQEVYGDILPTSSRKLLHETVHNSLFLGQGLVAQRPQIMVIVGLKPTKDSPGYFAPRTFLASDLLGNPTPFIPITAILGEMVKPAFYYLQSRQGLASISGNYIRSSEPTSGVFYVFKKYGNVDTPYRYSLVSML